MGAYKRRVENGGFVDGGDSNPIVTFFRKPKVVLKKQGDKGA